MLFTTKFSAIPSLAHLRRVSHLVRGIKMSTPNPLVVFVLGGPGAGKGTQCSRIVEVGGNENQVPVVM